ncbi:uncharacterized protein LOC127806530 [Diospyros lotus]|uniref:uncharacterized protein LOC127806530 n=1 Tax=Diospyros lotus TaxID=55363 RepID=UPI00224F7EB3|nr:uncharacterized protein LOC127806530 [Diospyros lotus]XP_052199851.1 uncharacterized protein LOC127806530 [Diospyros lotus]
MSSVRLEDANDQDLVDGTCLEKADDDQSMDELKPSSAQAENPLPSPQQEEEIIKKKYGGILPKKKPLISKDHERAFFDSADWALGKQGTQKAKGPPEALRPKLQPTPHQQLRSRRSAYAPPDDNEEVDGSNIHDDNCPEDQSCKLDSSSNSNSPL